MKDKAIIAGMLGLAFLSVAVDFAVYILSMLTDLLFVGGFLYLGWQLLRNKNERLREAEAKARTLEQANKALLNQIGLKVREHNAGVLASIRNPGA